MPSVFLADTVHLNEDPFIELGQEMESFVWTAVSLKATDVNESDVEAESPLEKWRVKVTEW
jgi:hypothetical protein